MAQEGEGTTYSRCMNSGWQSRPGNLGSAPNSAPFLLFMAIEAYAKATCIVVAPIG